MQGNKFPVAIGDRVELIREGRGSREGLPTHGVVVGLYEKFALLEFPAGYKEAWHYDRLVPVKGAKQRAG